MNKWTVTSLAKFIQAAPSYSIAFNESGSIRLPVPDSVTIGKSASVEEIGLSPVVIEY